tara:strand:- start:3515 stop:3718 length:204 start_codon:yes stop_codon:yes gene_type:complete
MKTITVCGRKVIRGTYDPLDNMTYLHPVNSREKFNCGKSFDTWVKKLNSEYGYATGHELSVWVSGKI